MVGPGPREVGPEAWGRELVVTSVMEGCALIAGEGSVNGRGEPAPPSGEPSRLITSGAGSEGVTPVIADKLEAPICFAASAG